MATTTRLMTVEQFRQLPEEQFRHYELRHGELVKVTPPKLKHALIQNRLVDRLRTAARPGGLVSMELGFRALPEHELRSADVGFVTKERMESADPEDNLHGAPDLTIEVLSPSNTAAEMNEREKLCLENGCQEFWTVDAKLRQVKVSTPDGITTTYRAGQEIPLRIFGAGSLNVDAIWG